MSDTPTREVAEMNTEQAPKRDKTCPVGFAFFTDEDGFVVPSSATKPAYKSDLTRPVVAINATHFHKI